MFKDNCTSEASDKHTDPKVADSDPFKQSLAKNHTSKLTHKNLMFENVLAA
jgi:hypothetical protein